MTDQAELIANDVAHEIFVQSGELLVNVTSARPLGDTIQKELQTVLCAQTGAKKVVLTERIDADLLGGLVAHTPDQQLDTTVRSQLQQLATIK
jgi:F-type H+-transporting ATPase subunit delta